MPASAEDVVEQLRYGMPPSDHVRTFTVGRDSQVRELYRSLSCVENNALLIHANYGTGKSHLLRLLREIAIERGFAVALIVADAHGSVRFNRMDTVFGAICQVLEIPGHRERGVGVLFDAYRQVDESTLSPCAIAERKRISNGDIWDVDDSFRLWAPGLYIALRAWFHARRDRAVRDRIRSWLSSPHTHRAQRTALYRDLVWGLRGHFCDPRPQWQLIQNDVFSFHTNGYRNSWSALRDLDHIARCSGYEGLVLLVDEFEDVIHNLARIDYKQQAFHNLFRFFTGTDFPGRSYFAVTPDFTHKCRVELWKRGVYGFDEGQLDNLAFFWLDPITSSDLFLLAKSICEVHSIAYGWDARKAVENRELEDYCERLMANEVPDRTRQAVISIVELLDDMVSDE